MFRNRQAIQNLSREFMRSRTHVPSVEAERIRILQLERGRWAGIGGRRAMSTAQWEGIGDRDYTGDTKLPPSPHLGPADAQAPNVKSELKSLNQNSPKTTQIKAEIQRQAGSKTMTELDQELQAKLEGVSGEGGVAGVEYEGGKAVGLKRGVRENMFRVI